MFKMCTLLEMVWCTWVLLRWTGDQFYRYFVSILVNHVPSCIVAEPGGVLRTFYSSGLMLGMAKHSSTARKRCPVSSVWECFWRIEDVCYSELCTKDGGKIVDCCSLVLALILCVHGLPVSSRAQQICSKSAPSWSALIVLSMRSANIAARNR